MRAVEIPLFFCLLNVFVAPSAGAAGLVPFSSDAEVCELSAHSPDEIIERLAQSYSGLLEFGGDEFTGARLEALLRDDVPAVSFFENVPNADQRSSALNSSLTRLGDWVALDAEDQGVDLNQLRVRLQAVIRQRLRQADEARVAVQTITEERQVLRDPRPRSMSMLHDLSVARVKDALIVDEGKKLIVLSQNDEISLWDLEGMRGLRKFSVTAKGLHELGADLDRVLISVRSPVFGDFEFKFLNWRTGEVTASPIGFGLLPQWTGVSVSPCGTWMLSPHENDERETSYLLIELETGRILRSFLWSGWFRYSNLKWSADGTRFAWTVRGDDGRLYLDVYQRSLDRYGHADFSRAFSAPIPLIGDPRDDVFFNEDLSRVMTTGASSGSEYSDLVGYQITESGLREEWRQPNLYRDGIRFINPSEFVRINWIVRGSAVIERRSSSTGELLDSLSVSPVASAVDRLFVFSPSGRFLAVVASNSDRNIRVEVWDLKTHRVLTHQVSNDPYVSVSVDRMQFADDERLVVFSHVFEQGSSSRAVTTVLEVGEMIRSDLALSPASR